MYELRILNAAEDDLARLDRTVGERIVSRIQWLADHFDEIKPQLLTGTLSGFFKLRVGNFRAVYKVIKDQNLIVVHRIGHGEVYRP